MLICIWQYVPSKLYLKLLPIPLSLQNVYFLPRTPWTIPDTVAAAPDTASAVVDAAADATLTVPWAALFTVSAADESVLLTAWIPC